MTFQVSSRGVIKNILLDRSAPPTSQEAYAVGFAVAEFAFAAVHSHPWKAGETRPVMITLPPGYEELEAEINKIEGGSSMTFRRRVTLKGRPAAEFDYQQALPVAQHGLKGKAEVTGQYWVDVKTGIPLQKRKEIILVDSAKGRFEVRSLETLSIAESNGLASLP